ncbi:thiamine permease [Pseudonocardia kujensis]|uniref:purine-cytosine permease family protein n=1 Tax=Pseudonocardia kujensis TaxID=1128675 RepID=UPI001E492579|nr:thiamine permease [Pseudonocardia kujensis]MCE0762640.1 thiamine permease [Pseudonocardia kujensis]
MSGDTGDTAVSSTAGTKLPALDISHHDDPAVLAEASRDDYALHVVPRSWRLPAPKMALAWSSVMAAMFWVVVAAGASLVVGTRQALIGLVAAVLVHGGICIVMSRTAASTGLTVGLFSRALFGYRGAAVATLALALTGTWFAVFEGSVLAVAAQAEFGGPVQLWYAVVTVCAIGLALGGVRVWLEKVNALLLPVFAVGLVVTVVWSTVAYGYDSAWLTAEAQTPTRMAGPGWLFVFAIYMGVFSNMLYTFDFARMGRVQDSRRNGLHTFGFTFYFFTILVNGAVGIYLVHTLPLADVSESGLVQGIVKLMGVVGLLFIVATQTKINTANFYVGSTNFQSFFSRTFGLNLSRTVWVIVVGVVSFGVMILNIFSFINTWLAYQGTILVAWVGIALVFVVARRRVGLPAFEFRPGRVPGVNPAGLTAWIVSSGVGIVLIATGSPIASTWALVLTFAVSVLVSAALLAVSGNRWAALGRPHDPRDEVADVWDDRIRCHSCERSYVAVEMDRDPSRGHLPICASCATGHTFRAAAVAESTAS